MHCADARSERRALILEIQKVSLSCSRLLRSHKFTKQPSDIACLNDLQTHSAFISHLLRGDTPQYRPATMARATQDHRGEVRLLGWRLL